jgi:hypothetical protein
VPPSSQRENMLRVSQVRQRICSELSTKMS